jgi:homocysteine S-methyltransferase
MLPLFSTRHANFLHHEVPGITIPKTLLKRMDKAGDDAVKEGIRIITELVDQIRPWASGVYIMPQFSRYDVVAEIVEAVK